ncbi:hypothetical protein [Falsiroseomonas sp.]|uniref:hypothetical protein n=1 Tax=Falsiroseomonas sp. TaxID=2870721 RepID=UPI00271A6D37|nr:hypothetical protein [Falsiroseomonas sp.]MDO9500512.1 hypothetical protein [Falsiroseomonas sp.]
MQTFPAETLPTPTRQDLIDSLADLGWQHLRHAPAAGQPSLAGPLILAHPAHGLALLDLAHEEPAPEDHEKVAGDLRQRLRSAGLDGLPIIHRVLGPGDGWRLSGILDQAFATAPPLDAPGGTGPDWVEQVQHALRPAPSRPDYGALPARPPARATQPAHPLLIFWGAIMGCAALTAGVLQLLGPPQAATPAEPAQARQAAPLPVPAPPEIARPASASAAPVSPATPHRDPPAADALPLPPPAAPALATAELAPGPGEVAPRIFVHHVAASTAAAAALAERAARLGGSVEVRAVPFTPAGRQVRYFRTSDAALAKRLATALGPGWRLHDLTRFTPQPSPGTLEVWLPAEE